MSAWQEFSDYVTTADNWWGDNGIAHRIVDHLRISVAAVAVRVRRRHPTGAVARAHPPRRRDGHGAREHRPGRAELRHPRPRLPAVARATASGSGSGRRSSPSSPSPSRRSSRTPTPASSASTTPSSTRRRGMGMRGARGAATGRGAERAAAAPHRRARLGGTGRGHGDVGRLRRLRRTRRLHQRGLPSTERRQAPHRRGARRGARHRRRARLWGRAAQAHALADPEREHDDQPTPEVGSRPPRPVRPRRRRVRRRRRRPTTAHGAETRRLLGGDAPDGAPEIVIGAQDFGESRILSELYGSASRRPGTRCRSRSSAASATSRSRRSSPATSTSRRSTRRRCSSSSTRTRPRRRATSSETVELLNERLEAIDLHRPRAVGRGRHQRLRRHAGDLRRARA